MGKNGTLLVRFRVGHISELLDEALPSGHTHRWTVFVRSLTDEDFKDRSFVEKVCFNLHPDFPNCKRTVSKPPYQVTETGYGGFQIPVHIWFAGKRYQVNYDLSLTMEKSATYFTTMTIGVSDYSPEFYSVAKRFGAEKQKQKRELDSGLGFASGDSASPPPTKLRKKERSADVSARSSPIPPLDKVKMLGSREEKERMVLPRIEEEKERKKEKSPIGKEKRREEIPPDPKERKKKDKMLDFVMERARPSPSPSPAVEKLKKEERKKEGSVIGSRPSSPLERIKKEEKRKEKDDRIASSPSEKEKRKEKVDVDRLSLSVKEKDKEKREKKEKDGDALVVSPPEKKEKREKMAERLALPLPEKEKERKKEKEKEKELSLMPFEREKKEKKESKREKEKDKDQLREKERMKSTIEKERIERSSLASSITPPPLLLRQEIPPSSIASSTRSVSPPVLVNMANGHRSRASSSTYGGGGASGSTVASQQSTSAVPSHSSALNVSLPPYSSSFSLQPSPSGSLGGRETPSEKASRSSISPGLRNEETASSGGSSASSISSDRREKRIPKIAPTKEGREAMSAPLASIDASTVRRKLESLTDPDIVYEVANLLLDLDDTSHVSSKTTSLSFDLSNLDQKELLKLDSVLNGNS